MPERFARLYTPLIEASVRFRVTVFQVSGFPGRRRSPKQGERPEFREIVSPRPSCQSKKAALNPP